MVRAPFVTYLTLSLNEFCGYFPLSQASQAGSSEVRGGSTPPLTYAKVLCQTKVKPRAFEYYTVLEGQEKV